MSRITRSNPRRHHAHPVMPTTTAGKHLLDDLRLFLYEERALPDPDIEAILVLVRLGVVMAEIQAVTDHGK